MNCNFTLKHYEEILQLAKQKKYVFATMKEHDKFIYQKKIIFLRHDIDFDIKKAMNFAKIEYKKGISATYFIRVHGAYNVFSLENYKLIKELLKMGHEIGLHYESDFPNLLNENENDFFKREKATLENITGIKIMGVAPHEPTRTKSFINDKNLKQFGLKYHSYSDKFIKELKYISDSSCRWREGCVCEFIKRDVPKLVVLTHPIWWYKNSPIENY